MGAPRRDDAKYRWYLVALLSCCGACNYAYRVTLSSVFPLLRADLGLSDLALASLGSVFLWSYATASPFAGYVADHVSRSRAIAVSLAVWSIASGLAGLARNGGELIVTRVLLGLAECVYIPASVALIAEHHPERTRASAMAIHVAGMSVGVIGGGYLGGYLGEQFGWRAMCFILGAGGVALAGVAWRFLRDGPLRSDEKRAKKSAAPQSKIAEAIEIFRTRSYLIIMGEAMSVSAAVWIFSTWMPSYYQEEFGMSLAGAGLAGTFMIESGNMLGMLAGGAHSDRIAARNPARRMLMQAIALGVAAPCLLIFAVGPSYALISAALFVSAVGRQVSGANEHPIVCDVLSPHQRSTAIGCMNSMSCFAGGLGVMVSGYLKSRVGLTAVMSGTSVLVAMAAALTMIGYLRFIRSDLESRKPTLVEST